MKNHFITCLFAAVAVLASCNTEKEHDIRHIFSIDGGRVNVPVGENVQAGYSYVRVSDGFFEKTEYDFTTNPADIHFISSDESVATVSATGIIHGVGVGSSVISATMEGKTVNGTLAVSVYDAGDQSHVFDKDLGTALQKSNIYMPVGLTHATMQGFDFDRRGNVYMAWEENEKMQVRMYPGGNSIASGDMYLPASGHGDSFCIEQDKDEVYFWSPASLGEPNGGYSGAVANDSDVHLICRFKWEPGKTVYAEDAVECFYINDNGCRIVDLDTEHDVMVCWGYENKAECVRIYSISSIRNAKKVVKTVSRAHNCGTEVQAYDLTSVPELAKFSWNRDIVCGKTDEGGYRAIQGLCIYDDKIYVEAGIKTDKACTISILDFKGTMLQTCTPIGFSTDKQKLIDYNLSSDGSFEPEGIHIRNGVMYMGFVGTYKTTGSKQHACILAL